MPFDPLRASPPALVCSLRGTAGVSLTDHAGLSPFARARLESLVRDHRGLDDVVRWGQAQTPVVRIAEAVIQDELTHDVLVPLPRAFLEGAAPPADASTDAAPGASPGTGPLWLVYDTT